jgi:hypothetical protein
MEFLKSTALSQTCHLCATAVQQERQLDASVHSMQQLQTYKAIEASKTPLLCSVIEGQNSSATLCGGGAQNQVYR